jgi:hypothetical protein
LLNEILSWVVKKGSLRGQNEHKDKFLCYIFRSESLLLCVIRRLCERFIYLEDRPRLEKNILLKEEERCE